jgi:phospholipid/cholesterol/gamma-HCH transport system substrate-binding protein
MVDRRVGSAVMSGGVLLTAICFVLFAISATRSSVGSDVRVRSIFSSSSGLAVGSAVELAGVVVGKVVSISLDPRSDLAVVTFTRPRDLALPADSALAVRGGGPSASASVSIVPGHSPSALQTGGTITRTAPARSLEDDIGDFIFGNGGLGDTQ